MGKSSIDGSFSMAMLNNQRVYILMFTYHNKYLKEIQRHQTRAKLDPADVGRADSSCVQADALAPSLLEVLSPV